MLDNLDDSRHSEGMLWGFGRWAGRFNRRGRRGRRDSAECELRLLSASSAPSAV